MNFEITWKSAGVLCVSLIVGGVIGAWLDSPMAGIGVPLCAIAYLANCPK